MASRQDFAQEGQRVSGDPAGVSPATTGRSLLAILLGRGLSRLAGWVAPLGRASLYIGLLLVAFTALRLPGETGTVGDVFLFVSMMCVFLLLLQGRPLRIAPLRAHVIGSGLVISGVLIGTLARASDDWQSLLQLSKFFFATTATIVTCMVLLERRSQLRTAFGCWIVSAAVTSVTAMLQAFLGDWLSADEPVWRMTGLSGHPNRLGAVAGMAIGGALCLAAISDRLTRVLWLTAAIVCIFGVVASASRAGAVIALASVGLWAIMSYRLRREFTILVLGCCLAGAAVASFVYVQVWSGVDVSGRFASATDPYADGAVAERLYQYEDIVRDGLRNPFFGVGLAEREIKAGGILVHNTLLMLLRGGGLLSVFGIVIILVDLLRKGLIAYAQAGSPTSKCLAIGLFTGVVGLTLDGLVEPVLFQRQYWLPSALLLALLALPRRHGEARGEVRKQIHTKRWVHRSRVRRTEMGFSEHERGQFDARK